MNLHPILIIIFLCVVASASCSQSDFVSTRPSSDNSVILSKIIINFLEKYFSNAGIYVSIILPPSERGKHNFLDDFFIEFFNDPRMKMFAINILDKLEIKTTKWRQTFDLILVKNSESVQ